MWLSSLAPLVFLLSKTFKSLARKKKDSTKNAAIRYMNIKILNNDLKS
jgi:hypothetical protein